MSVFRAAKILATGNGISQAITLAGYVLLGRMYEPESFGLLGVIAGIGTIGGTAASLRYDFTVLLPRHQRTADVAVYTSLLLALASSIAVTVAVAFASLMGWGGWSAYWWLIGPMVFSLAVINVLGFVQNRQARYAEISAVQIVRSLVMVGVSLSLVGNQAGLVIGHTMGAVSGSAAAMFLVQRSGGHVYVPATLPRVRAWLRKHNKFPKYSFPAVFVSSFSMQLPVFLISFLFGQQAAGYFTVIQRTVSGPTQLISRAINKVYLRTLAQKRANRQPIAAFQASIIWHTSLATIVLSTAFAIFCLLGGYELLFGPRWQGLSRLALVLLPVMLFGFIAKTVASFAVLDRNEIGLAYQLFLAVSTFVAIYVPQAFGFGLGETLASYSVAVSGAYLIQILSVRALARQVDASLG